MESNGNPFQKQKALSEYTLIFVKKDPYIFFDKNDMKNILMSV